MATRWFLSKSAPAITPSALGTWDTVGTTRYALETVAGSDASFTLSSLTVSAGTNTTLRRTWISPGMAAGVVFNSSSTFKLIISCDESTSAGDLYLRAVMTVTNEAGASMGYQWESTDATEFTALVDEAARELNVTGLAGSYTTVAGDRIVLEVGWYKGASGSVSGAMRWGNVTADVLDAPGDTGLENPYFEISMTAGTGTGGGGAPASLVEDFQIEGFITGVLDEWA